MKVMRAYAVVVADQRSSLDPREFNLID